MHGLLKDSLVCPRCGGEEVWRIAAVGERAIGVEQMAVVHSQDGERSRGRFELFVCHRCGYTEWYARGLEGVEEVFRSQDVEVLQAEGPCPGCKSVRLYRIRTMRELGAGWLDPVPMGLLPRYQFQVLIADDPVGRLETRVCTGCGHARWYARGLHELDLRRRWEVERIEGVCERCPSAKGWRIRPMYEISAWSRRGVDRAVAFVPHWLLGRRARGLFEGRVCGRCGHLEWFAHGLEKLRESPRAGIYHLRRPLAPKTGPYR